MTVSSEAERAAIRRAIPIARLLAGSLELADAEQLHHRSEAGEDWSEIAAELGESQLARAETLLRDELIAAAEGAFYRAANAFRFAQAPLPDTDDRKYRLYSRLIDAFGRGGALRRPPMQHLSVPVEGGAVAGWLVPTAAAGPRPLVVVFGGFDGWREEYLPCALAAAESGLACVLLDLPGQGETRLRHGLRFSDSVPREVESVLAAIRGRQPFTDVGLWGNSFGGYVAIWLAATLRSVRACCSNGGAVWPGRLLERHPRFIAKAAPFFSAGDPAAAMRALDLTPHLRRLRCPLLVAHGELDTVFPLGEARQLYELAASSSKRLLVFPGAEHCSYSRWRERDATIAAWFSHVLQGAAPG